MRALQFFCLLIFAGWLGCGSALADKRVALIIGNSAYQNVPRLVNPGNDAKIISATLKSAGFDLVDLKLDLRIADMRHAIRDFSDVARTADVAVIYYAGHGMEIDGVNYIIPTDATLERDVDAFDEALPLDRLLTVIEPAKQLRLVILDACRDNPFGPKMKRTMAGRTIGRGLAKVEPDNPNTLIAFSAKAGSTASDGDGKGSPFTSALANHLTTPGLDLRRAFGYVRDDVLKETNGKQEPFVYGSLGGDDFPLVPAKPVANSQPAAAEPQLNLQDAVRKDYELAIQLGTKDGWRAFLSHYTEGFYVDLAKAQLNKIVANEGSQHVKIPATKPVEGLDTTSRKKMSKETVLGTNARGELQRIPAPHGMNRCMKNGALMGYTVDQTRSYCARRAAENWH
jgi:hypothetical protein